MAIRPIFFLWVFGMLAVQAAAQIENDSYRVLVPTDFRRTPRVLITHKASGISREVRPQLRLIFSAEQPQLTPANMDGYRGLVGWKNADQQIEKNVFSLPGVTVLATAVQQEGKRLNFTFKPTAFGEPVLTIELPEGGEAPSFIMGIHTRRDGWYSLGFTGLSPVAPDQLDFLYQPLTWSWKRFPSETALTEEAYCTTAATFINTAGFTEGIAPAADMIPYRYALSTHWSNKASDQVGSGFAYTERKGNSLFGLAVRNAEGQAQPLLFAPLPGGDRSQMAAGQTYRFTCKYLLTPGDWLAGSDYLLRHIANYVNERQNGVVSLNETLENMIDFGMNDRLSGWEEEYKAFDYRFDAPGTVKLVSAMHALGVALSTGDADIYRRRALPMMEYVMSRQKFLFAIDTAQKMQNPAYRLRGPCAEIGELAGLHQLLSGQSAAFAQEADRIFGQARQLNLQTVTGGASWRDYLARYRMSGADADLQEAKRGASDYIDTYLDHYPADFKSNPGLADRQAAFQVDFTTNIYDLFELWELTREKHFLEAAHTGARHLLLWTRSNPLAPDSVITVNEGGTVDGIFPGRREGVESHAFVSRDMTTRIPEQKIPAWRTSLVGALPEQHSTYVYGPILLANHAPWFLRIAALTGDSLLADAAYNGVLGRYANFPGYYFNSLYTNVYQTADYPVHDYYDIRYNAVFYNHLWPHIAVLNDFLVSDAFYRSGGQVDFPSVYAPGYAFLTSKVYGHGTGRIFDHENIRLWMPARALRSSSTAVNHLFGIGPDALYLVLMNTAPDEEVVSLQLNQDVITYDTDRTYQTQLYQRGRTTSGRTTNGKLDLRIPAQGLTVVRIEDLIMDIPFLEQLDEPTTAGRQTYFRQVNEDPTLGTLTGMLFNLSPETADAYIYSDAAPADLQRAHLQYRFGDGPWQQLTDAVYPFEFSVHLTDPRQQLELKWISEKATGERSESSLPRLQN